MGILNEACGFDKICWKEFMKNLKEISVKDKKALVRVDFNVPIENGVVQDDTRVRATLPTIKYLIDNGAIVILMSHLGRPKGQIKKELSLEPVAKVLSNLINQDVRFAHDCIGDIAKSIINESRQGDVILLENLRFHPEEKENDTEFSQKLAELGNIYINDAFGTAHRRHSSTYGVAKFFKEKASGFLLKKEIESLSQIRDNPQHPFTVILGGAKISTKMGVINNFLTRADKLLLGGGMIFNFFKSQGIEVGNSLVEEDKIEDAREIMKKAAKQNITFLLPVDIVIAKEFKNDAEKKVVSKDKIEKEWMGLDIGPVTARIYAEAIKGSENILWNGPMGVFEMENFRKGTEIIGKAVSGETNKGAFSVVGGGDTISCINILKIDKISHISTGGGASLKFLAGESLPGIEALEE